MVKVLEKTHLTPDMKVAQGLYRGTTTEQILQYLADCTTTIAGEERHVQILASKLSRLFPASDSISDIEAELKDERYVVGNEGWLGISAYGLTEAQKILDRYAIVPVEPLKKLNGRNGNGAKRKAPTNPPISKDGRLSEFGDRFVDYVLAYSIKHHDGAVNEYIVRNAAIAADIACTTEDALSFSNWLERDCHTEGGYVSRAMRRFLEGTVPIYEAPSSRTQQPKNFSSRKRKEEHVTPKDIKEEKTVPPVTGTRLSPRAIALLYHIDANGGSIAKRTAKDMFPGISRNIYHSLFQNMSKSGYIENMGNETYRIADTGNELLASFSPEHLEAIIKAADGTSTYKNGSKYNEIIARILKHGIETEHGITKKRIATLIASWAPGKNVAGRAVDYLTSFQDKGYITETGAVTQAARDFVKRYEAKQARIASLPERPKPRQDAIRLAILYDGLKNNGTVDEALIMRTFEALSSEKSIFPARAREYIKRLKRDGLIKNSQVTKKGEVYVSQGLKNLEKALTPQKPKEGDPLVRAIGATRARVVRYSLEHYRGALTRDIVAEALSSNGHVYCESAPINCFKTFTRDGHVVDGSVIESLRQLA